MKLFEYSECLKLAERESQDDHPLLGESASPFIGEGDGLTSLDRERKRVFTSLIAHVVGYKIVCRRPQYY